MTTTATEIQGLRALAPSPLPFAPSYEVRTFHLERPDGDVLVYASPGDVADGATRQYLGHYHEVMVGDAAPGAQLIIHAGDAEAAAGHGADTHATFDRPFRLGDDLEAIPIPGHTPGSVAYRWTAPDGQRVLFTTDSVAPDETGRWRGAVLGESDRAAYADSVDRLAALPFDVLAPWAVPAGAPPVVLTDPDAARAQLLALRDRIRGGEDA